MFNLVKLVIAISVFRKICFSEGFYTSFPLHGKLHRGNQSRVLLATEKEDKSCTNPKLLYPVISRIANANWTGSCRYTGADLKPVNIKLVGGLRYDILRNNERNKDDKEDQQYIVKLSSFLTFPNEKSRGCSRGQQKYGK